MDDQDLETLSSFFSQALQEKRGAVGFAQGILEDADDTARALLTLQYLGKNPDLTSLIERFEGSACFKTYELEQISSVSVNCNALLALLNTTLIEQYRTSIEVAVQFVLSEHDRGQISDKWNLSPNYSRMLISSALIRLLEKYDEGCLRQVPTDRVGRQVLLALCQMVSKTLCEQQKDGGWGHSPEVTAYCVIMIAQSLSLPWNPALRSQLETCLMLGRRLIAAAIDQSPAPTYHWVEKVTYGSSLLQKVYCHAALQMPYHERRWNDKIGSRFSQPDEGAKKWRGLLSRLPLVQDSVPVSIDMAIAEAGHFSTRMIEARETVFPRHKMPMTNDRYLQVIPILWAISNQIGRETLSCETMWNMMLLSLLNYQVDEYMESVVIYLSEPNVRFLAILLADECGLGEELESDNASQTVRVNPVDWLRADSELSSSSARSPKNGENGIGRLDNVIAVLSKYIKHILHHPKVLQSPKAVRKGLGIELYNFLLAHISHNLDNLQLRAEEEPLNGQAPRKTLETDRK